MLGILQWVLAAVLGVLLFWGGYKVGAGQLAEFKTKAEEAEARRVATQTALEKAATEQKVEHDKKMSDLEAAAKSGAANLDKAISGAKTRESELKKSVDEKSAQVKKLEADKAAATDSGRKEIDTLKKEIEKLRTQMDPSVACLGLPVPEPVIRPLIR